MTKETIIATLTKLNPGIKPARIVICADAVADYRESQANINEHGTIAFHPRTGAPIANPYLPIRDSAAKRITASRLDVGNLLSL